MCKRIPLSQFRDGMYVAAVDYSWFRTPFLRRRFLVQDVGQIERLQRSNIHAVEIDPSWDRSVPRSIERVITSESAETSHAA